LSRAAPVTPPAPRDRSLRVSPACGTPGASAGLLIQTSRAGHLSIGRNLLLEIMIWICFFGKKRHTNLPRVRPPHGTPSATRPEAVPDGPSSLSLKAVGHRSAASAATGTPRAFQEDHTHQLDPLRGCPEEAVPAGHLARQVQAWVAAWETRALEAGYSSLGRHGIHPRNRLAVWIYARLVGLHYATQVGARPGRPTTPSGCFSGGHTVQETTLCTLRREHGAFLAQAVG
jgi:hypothetical protein